MCARTRNRPAAGRDPGLGGVTQARPRPRPDHPRPLRLGPGRRGSAGSGDLDYLCLLVAGTVMTGERPRLLHPAEQLDPVERLWRELPELWRGPILGPGIEGWRKISENGERRRDRTGLPDPFPKELAWMAHWQAADGTRSSVLAMNQLANILRRALAHGRPFPSSMLSLDWEAAEDLQGWFYATRCGRLPPKDARSRLRVIFRFARQALIARCADGPWWSLDYWHPRCDPRIPLAEREPVANYGCSPGKIALPWLREAVKRHLGTMLESGALRWTTVSQERITCVTRFDRWLAASFDD